VSLSNNFHTHFVTSHRFAAAMTALKFFSALALLVAVFGSAMAGGYYPKPYDGSAAAAASSAAAAGGGGAAAASAAAAAAGGGGAAAAASAAAAAGGHKPYYYKPYYPKHY
jgi:hypothetical protein